MKVEIIPCLKDNYSYVIIDEKNKKTCVIDPGEPKPIINFVEKNNLKLNYILNTHHHFDHVGGNIELKKKYNAKVIGFEGDKKRIPGIDIILKDKEVWKENRFEAQILHIPGHTLGHICYHFYNNDNLFTGDTLFSLGCGRIFEGTHEQMLNSLNIIKKLPRDTMIYCGHEYTYKNAEFCMKYDLDNIDLKKKFEKIKKLRSKNLPTIPTSLEDELKLNIFLKCDQNGLKSKLNMKNQEDFKVFKKVRDLKDSF